MLPRQNELATMLSLCDATERPFDLCHFNGLGMMTLSLRRCRDNTLHIGPALAADLARFFDHFSRCHELPTRFPQPDYMI